MTFHIQTAKVAVLMGGLSAERDVSIMSGSGVLKALQSKGVNATAFDPAERPLAAARRRPGPRGPRLGRRRGRRRDRGRRPHLEHLVAERHRVAVGERPIDIARADHPRGRDS